MEFTHIKNGKAQQVDISNKPIALRRALAEGTIELKPETIESDKARFDRKRKRAKHRDS